MMISKLVGKNNTLITQIIQNTLKSKNLSLMRNQRLKLAVLKNTSQAKNHKSHKNKDNSKSRREYF